MPSTPNFADYLLLACVGLFTLLAAVVDVRFRKIPNKLTVPFFALGLIYQTAFHGLAGLGNGLLAFAVGFGLMFVLWAIGSGGGGDVKLIGALAVWLTLPMTLWIFFLSTLFVILGTVFVLSWSGLASGMGKTRRRYLESTREDGSLKPRERRRTMAFALPVALATWIVVAVNVFGMMPVRGA